MTPTDLRAWRKRLGLTQSEAASQMGYTSQQWGRWERGISPVPPVISLAVGYVTLTGQWRFPPTMPAE